MSHTLEVEDGGIVKVSFVGDSSDHAMAEFQKAFDPVLASCTEAEPALVMVDVSQAGKLSAAGRRQVAQQGRDLRIGRIAFVGMSTYARVLAGFINRATGRDNVRFFRSRAEAVDWLMHEPGRADGVGRGGR